MSPTTSICLPGAKSPKRDSNVHLVVKHRSGAIASVGSLYGVTFTIYDALAIRILPLPTGSFGLDAGFTECKNFQFGVQIYGYHPRRDVTLAVQDPDSHAPAISTDEEA